MMAKSRSVSRSVKAAVGSSITTIRALRESTLAISIICCWATDSRPVSTLSGIAIPRSAKVAAARSRAARSALRSAWARPSASRAAASAAFARAAASCAVAPRDYQPWCHTGVARNLVDISSDPRDGFAYCATLADNVSKVTCYSSIGEEIQSITVDEAKRRDSCSGAPAPFDRACLYGAGVIHDAPAGLAKST